MKPGDQTVTRVSRGWALVVLVWLLIAVAAPAVSVWLSSDPPPETADLDEQALATQRAKAQAWLDSYGWIDREAGVARVPVEEGMKAVLRRGLPVRDVSEETR